MDIRVGRELLVGKGEVARIDDDRKVRAAAELVGGIDRVVKTLVKVSAEGSGKVGSGGESEDAGTVRINMPLCGLGAHDSKSALGILKRGRRLGIRPGIGYAVFQEHASDARGVEPVADLGAFEVDGKNSVRASGKHHHSGASVLALRRVEGECRRRNVSDANDQLAGNHVVLGGGGITLRRWIGLGAGCPMWPDVQSAVAGRTPHSTSK